MNISAIQDRIQSSDEFVLAETKKIQYGYGLKQTIRYMIERDEVIASESVAEHVYGMFLLADYFLPLEDAEKQWDWHRVRQMILYHDFDEIETGDVVSYLKTDAQRAEEAEMMKRVIEKMPTHMQANFASVTSEYEAQATVEARFTKAIDRIEPAFQLFNANGKQVLQYQKTTLEQGRSTKVAYVKPFPYIKRFHQVIEKEMVKLGFFYPS
jgi:5'-deoxynucleotidase YfbR-like HD superfamily hydrolase